MPRWKTKMVIEKNGVTIMNNFLESYAEAHGLPSPGRNVNRVIILTSRSELYSPIASFGENNAFRKLWFLHLTFKYNPRTDSCDTCQYFKNDLQCSQGGRSER
ncbi:hypothetical protein Glove_583g5 [Diversispora epigaea]|uniref:Uncharacterized protein n=1 Tax=Diversispora epigaea TaxID=1348612 RepID=A0A397G8R8_9GLOM|nr:hypothetical protein Glove_583g5 [Diversispora epigaea]